MFELTQLTYLHSRSELDGCQYRHPFADRVSPVVIGGSYITAESGTGLVHTAPGHGQEDYQVCAFTTLLVPLSLEYHDLPGSAGL